MWFVGGILMCQMWFDGDVFDFQIKLLCQYFAIFGHFFQKIGWNFNHFFGHNEYSIHTYTWSLHMQSLMIFAGVDSRYTWVRCLDNSQLSEALISKKKDMIENVKYLQHTFASYLKCIIRYRYWTKLQILSNILRIWTWIKTLKLSPGQT